MSRPGPARAHPAWPDAVRRHWETHPIVLQQPLTRPLLTPAEVLLGLQRAGERARAGDRMLPVQFFIEGDFRLESPRVADYLPGDEDRSLASYAARIAGQLDGRPFALVLSNFHLHYGELWLRLRDFLHEIPVRPGSYVATTSMFLGDYERTPYGIHRDTTSLFMFVVEGRKRILAWPGEYFPGDDDPRLAAGDRALAAAACVLEGVPGDVVYWPARYWHVGECVGGLSVTLSLGLKPAQPAAETWARVAGRIDALLEAQGESSAAPETQETIETSVQRAQAALSQVARDGSLAQELKVTWMNLVSGAGFEKVPPPLPWRSLDEADLVQGSSAYPILCVPAEGDSYLLSAAGHSFVVTARPDSLGLIRRLNTGAPIAVKDLLEAHKGNPQSEAAGVHRVLEKLLSLRAITVLTGAIQDP